ncbi:MAG: hypothetical protein BV456_10385 [Thermoplasmata archaeon M8B2D]|nr:MAG: hypothetical protein BV456_10385 [Thermoplasmata archaeon M8B2D]
MDISSAAIIPSNQSEVIKQCISYLRKQTDKFKIIVIVPWGNEKQRNMVKNVIKASNLSNIDIADLTNDMGIASSRNAGIRHLQKYCDSVDFIAFLDDDTYIDINWLKYMQEEAFMDNNDTIYSSVVRCHNNKDVIRSCGHHFDISARPLDHGYDKDIHELKNLSDSNPPFFPCANSAFIPLKAIEAIQVYESDVWDENFPRMTCFEFGLKLHLLKFKCKLVREARAIHYCKESKDENHVLNELYSRVLLYEKFFSKKEKDKAIRILEKDYVYGKWFKEGYSQAKTIKGRDIVNIYKCAKKKVEYISGEISDIWKKKLLSIKLIFFEMR